MPVECRMEYSAGTPLFCLHPLICSSVPWLAWVMALLCLCTAPSSALLCEHLPLVPRSSGRGQKGARSSLQNETC